MSWIIEPATSLPIEFSGPGRSPFDSAEIVRMLLDRLDLDAGAFHIQEEHGEPLVLGHIGIGAGEKDAVVGIMRPRGPDLLAIDDPTVAVFLRAGPQAGDIGTARGLGEQLAPYL